MTRIDRHHERGDRMPGTAIALVLSTHPGPAAAVTAMAIVLGIGSGLEPWRVVLLGLAVGANQASIGLSNDWIDADRDRAVGRVDKPIARGWVSVARVRAAAIGAAAIAIALTAPLGWLATLAHSVFIASAWAYNLRFKSTAFSVLPYIVSFGILPAIVTLARPEPAWAAGWAIGVGALLGVAAHVANVLPDLDDDRATGVRGLPHRLGRRASGIVIWVALVAASVLAFLGPAGATTALQWIGLVVTLSIAVVGVLSVLTREPSRFQFRLIIAAALVNVALLSVAGDRLLQ